MSMSEAETEARKVVGQVAAAIAAGAPANGAPSPAAPAAAETPAVEAPDLSDLPGRLKETVSTLPPEVQRAAVEVYRKDMLPHFKERTEAIAKERKEHEARLRNAEVAERIFASEDPEARRLLYEAAERAMGLKPAAHGNGKPAEPEAEEPDPYEVALQAADPKEFARKMREANKREYARLREEERAAQAREEAESNLAVQAEGQRLRAAWGSRLTDAEFKAAWDKAAAQAPAEFYAGNVGVALAPFLAEVIESKVAKPQPPAAVRPASVPGGAEFAQPAEVDPWVREKRPPTGAEIVRKALKPFGITVEGLREMQFSGGTRLMPPS